MTAMPLREEETLPGLIGRLSGQIEPLFDRFGIQAEEAGEILREVLLLLVYRWDRIENRDQWLLATLERNCQRRRRQPVPARTAP
jgi:hypothetical protein